MSYLIVVTLTSLVVLLICLRFHDKAITELRNLYFQDMELSKKLWFQNGVKYGRSNCACKKETE